MLLDHAPTTPPPSGAAVRWVGSGDARLLAAQHRRGRRRRWVYAAAGDDRVLVGAAVVHVGVLGLGTAFAFAVTPDAVHTWDAGPGRAGDVGGLSGTAAVARAGGRVAIDERRLRVDVPVEGGRLTAALDLGVASPVTLVTPTPRGGWNATTKAAGHVGAGAVVWPGGAHTLDGGAWTDATDGRQDAHTTWRWAAGAGRAEDGRRVGLHASTGMNATGPGEDLVWWDGVAVPMGVTTLTPDDEATPDGPWRLAGADWSLELDVAGVRAADEGLGPIRSRYAQPMGTWRGTLPDPEGRPVAVTLAGVAEDHEARW